MKGEVLGWFKLASRLHLTVDEVQQRTSSMCFVMWCAFFELEYNEKTKQDYYLAQIAAEVRRSYVKYPKKVKITDLLLSFGQASEKVEVKKEERIKRSKSFWNALVFGSKRRRR